MVKNIDPKLESIRDYLKLGNSGNFVIPEYQRSYSWDISQCDKLWQDIIKFIEEKAGDPYFDPYFFGTIIIDCSENDKKFSLIDGQQRTITFLLLLKALLLKLNDKIKNISQDEDSESLLAGLEANRNKIMAILFKAEDEEIPSMLKDPTKIEDILIIENKSINEQYPLEIAKILKAVDFNTAEKNVDKIPRKQKENKYTNYFRNFKYFYDKLSEKGESQINKFAKIFLEECQVIEIRSWQTEQAIMMFNSLNSTGMPLADADIISAKLYSNAGDDKKEFNEQWKEINRLTTELGSRRIVDIDSVLQQFMYIHRALEKEYNVATPSLRRYYTEDKKELLSAPLDLCENLLKIAQIWDKIKEFSIVKLLLRCNENVKLYLSSYLYRYNLEEITEPEVIRIGEYLLRLFVILELVDKGYSSSEFKVFLFRENIKFVDESISIDIIKNEFNEHIRNSWKEEDLSKSITDYDKNLLVFVNEYLYAKNKGLPFAFMDNVNIEHIMPSSGRNIDTIRQDANMDREEFEFIVNRLGNKILLEENINKSIGNEWFKTKKQNSVESKSGYKNSKYGLAKALTEYPNDSWTKEDIEKATNKAAERILKFIFNK